MQLELEKPVANVATNPYADAWYAVVDALDEVDPGWSDGYEKSHVQHAVEWIKARKDHEKKS